jgi:hypothetical protein
MQQLPDQEVLNSWVKFLHPQSLKSNLICAAVILVSWETLKRTVIDHARTFYWCGFDESGQDILSPEYKKEVVALHRSLFGASLRWFKEMKAIDDADVDASEQIIHW